MKTVSSSHSGGAPAFKRAFKFSFRSPCSKDHTPWRACRSLFCTYPAAVRAALKQSLCKTCHDEVVMEASSSHMRDDKPPK